MCHFQSTDTTRGFDASCLLYQPRSGGDDDVGNSVVLWFVYSTLIRLLYCTVGLSDRQTESALLYSTPSGFTTHCIPISSIVGLVDDLMTGAHSCCGSRFSPSLATAAAAAAAAETKRLQFSSSS